MPKFDGTGPKGEGPMTGHGRGYCVVPLEDVESPMIRKQLDSDSSLEDDKKITSDKETNE
ncbi:DUF5320 domain-containing protein [Maledivibacter halophilus]|uniref:Uncharacterized protein n=1 Tax=Maledivibacter halophilus TaxID=36842 RepID=A0A1T5LYN8_9FIRM|nr:DUF5320 domain-containing protein [Maledivibacter halophilus]SKC81087.1 hypothetical protein SAMN02194393_03542 [Maledivibacter halophilus]